MIELWIGLALLFACVGVFYWSKNRTPDQRELAERLYRRDIEADQPNDNKP